MVFVLSKNKKPLASTSNARARVLLKRKLAIVHSIYPFVIRLKKNKECKECFTIKIDPGATTTGIAIVDSKKALFFFELIHRGKVIKKALDARRAIRRSRRARNTRYRKPKFDNRTRPIGWLAPSIKSRADNIINFVMKYKKLIPITKAVIETVSFDTSSLTEGKRLFGAEYQQGSLYQTKLRSYLFSKHNSKCVYCGNQAEEIEHIIPKSKGGTNSIYNLAISCRKCNELKSNLSLKEFGKLQGQDYAHLESKTTPKQAAIIQSARNYTIEKIKELMDVETGEGWETSFNRKERELPKEHYYDALCVGSKSDYVIATSQVLIVKAQGRGSRQMCRMDKYGFPRTTAKQSKTVKGFQTGDIVKAIVPSGLKQGEYLGRVAVRSSGSFNITTNSKTIQGIRYKHCRLVQRDSGYAYNYKERNTTSSPYLKAGVSVVEII